jgi:hypothetical protein
MAIKWIINTSNGSELRCLLDVSIMLDCTFIYDELKNEAYHDHFSDEMLEYAKKIECCINKLNINMLTIDEIDKLQKIKFIINWLRFWGKNDFAFYVALTLT